MEHASRPYTGPGTHQYRVGRACLPCGQCRGMFPNWPSPTQDPDRMNVVEASQDDDRLRVTTQRWKLSTSWPESSIDHPGVEPRGMLRARSPHPRLVPMGGDRVVHEGRPWPGWMGDRRPGITRAAAEDAEALFGDPRHRGQRLGAGL
jgi:hypothetical protein